MRPGNWTNYRELMKDSSLQNPSYPFSPTIDGAKVPNKCCWAAFTSTGGGCRGDTSFQQADSIESKMVYNEPRDWILDPKHYPWAAAYLDQCRCGCAEKIFNRISGTTMKMAGIIRLAESMAAPGKKDKALRPTPF